MSPRTVRQVAATLAFAVAAAGCGATGSDQVGQAALPPPPPVVERTEDIDFLPTDGLHRVVVRPSAAAEDDPAATNAAADSESEPEVASAAAAANEQGASSAEGSRPKIDPDKLNLIEKNTIIVIEDGIPGFWNDAGDFVSLTAGDATAPPGAQPVAIQSTDPSAAMESTDPPQEMDTPQTMDPPQVMDPPQIAALRELDGIVSVVAIGDGSYAVTAEGPEVLQTATVDLGLALDVAEDATLGLSADPYEPYQWALDNTGSNLANVTSSAPTQLPDADIDGPEAAAGPRGQGVVVAVIDSGVDFSHPDLAGQQWINQNETCGNGVDDDGNGYVDDCVGWDFGYEDSIPWSAANGDHGTHVAGIIAATAGNGQGVTGAAPRSKIMNLSVAGPGGISTSSVARAVRYAVDNDAQIINMSLGSSPGTPVQAVIPMIEAVEYAEAAGVVVVVAAGNSNVNLSNAAVYPASIDADNMIVVGASTPAEAKASFSNYGPVVTLYAPGDLILSTIPGGYTFMSGTSQASPLVAAVAATIIENQPDADPAAVRQQIVGTADEIAAYNGVAANAVRLNGARAIGINPPEADAYSGAEVTISGLASADPDQVTANVTMADPGGLFDEPYRWEASVVALTSSGVYGIVDHELSIDGVSARTDERGAVVLGAAEIDTASLAMTLPEGSYGLIVEAVSTDDPDVRLGESVVATFDVTDPSSQQNGPSTTVTTTNPTTTSPTTSPSTATSTPSDTSPAPSTSTSTASTTTSTPTSGSPQTPQPTTGPGATTTTSPSSPATTSPSGSPSTTSSPTTPAGQTSSTRSSNTSQPGQGTGSTTTTTASTPGPGGTSATTTSQTTAGQTPTTTPTTNRTTTPAPVQTTAPTTPTSAVSTTQTTSVSGTTPGGSWAVYQIAPDVGPIGTETPVSITGSFPSSVYVWFGNQPGTIVYQSSDWILALTPAIAAPGPVDVRLRSNTVDISVANGFTFYDPAPTGGPTTQAPTTQAPATGGSGPTSTTSGPAATTTTVTGATTTWGPTQTTAPGASSSTTDPGGQTEPTNGTSTTTTTPSPSTNGPDASATSTSIVGSGPETGALLQSRARSLGSPVDLGNGLTGAPLGDLDELFNMPRCASDPCRVRRT